jgi:hypothetical protein
VFTKPELATIFEQIDAGRIAHEAADLIERQQARIAELEGIVRELLSALEDDGDYDNDATALEVAVDKSRAALEAK